ncbi:hypothetical protein ACFXKI_19555 [Streptomyces mirabilis]|uniref:hypothetical protein n=1 Tax=Streptomyces mirabilis TaxID=68239 RepID=UPI0036AF1B26
MQIARMYKPVKGSAAKARTRAINQLKAVLVSADPNLREELAGLNNAELFRTCARLADDGKNGEDGEEAVLQATRIILCLLAQRIGQLTEQIQDVDGRIRRAAGSRSATCRATASTLGRAYRSRERTEAWRERAGSIGVDAPPSAPCVRVLWRIRCSVQPSRAARCRCP